MRNSKRSRRDVIDFPFSLLKFSVRIMSESLASQDLVGFAVEPITNCPHIPDYKTNEKGPDLYHKPCQSCGDTKENWQCLHCQSVYCSRYCQGHMKQHVEDVPEHSVCISYSDLSVWCYECDNYITHDVRLFID